MRRLGDQIFGWRFSGAQRHYSAILPLAIRLPVPSIKEFIDAMSSSWPVALAVLLGSSAILAGDIYGIDQLASVPRWVVGAAFILAAFSSAVLLVLVLQMILDLLSLPVRLHRAKKWRAEHIRGLNDLSPPEQYVLTWAVANQTQVISAPYFDPRTKALSAKGYLLMVGGQHHSDQTPFRIPKHVWEVLCEDLPQKLDLGNFAKSPFSRW